MRRGDLYRVRRPPSDPRPARVFVVVSRQVLLDSKFSTAVCAPSTAAARTWAPRSLSARKKG